MALTSLLAEYNVESEAASLTRSGIHTLTSFARADLRASGCKIGSRARLRPAQAAAQAQLARDAPTARQPAAATVNARTPEPPSRVSAERWPSQALSIRDAVSAVSFQQCAQAPALARPAAGAELRARCGLHGRYAFSCEQCAREYHANLTHSSPTLTDFKRLIPTHVDSC